MTSTRPFYSRQGGKSKSAIKLIGQFPDDCDTYVEPFFGAGNIFFRVPSDKFKSEYINDLDPIVHQLIHDIQLLSDSDFNKMDFIANKDVWTHCHIHSGIMDTSDIPERFYCNLYALWYSYSSINKSYHAKRDKSRSIDILRKRLPIIQSRLLNATLTSIDVFDLLQQHIDNDKTFIFLDPPYLETSNVGYSNKTIDTTRLRDVLRQCRGKWMLTYNDHPVIRELYSDFHIQQHVVPYSMMGGRGVDRNELIITNYIPTNLS